MRRTALAVVAAGLVGTMVPAGPAQAHVVADKKGFGGFSVTSSATPIRLEVYEPTIPIPSEPQGEVDLAYTRTESATGPSAKGRASWIWPGDAVGEGFKTFVEQLGLPSQLGQYGYPVQVNSQAPGDPSSESQEPFPGTVMRTSASPEETVAKAGYSPDGDVSDQDPKSGGTPGAPGVPGAPGLPSVPGVPGPPTTDLSKLGAAITGKSVAADDPSSPVPSPPSGPALPPELAALVDVGGMTSVSRSVTQGDVVRSSGTSKIADLSLLAGLITADSVKVTTTATSNGAKATTAGAARVVGLSVAGRPVTVDRDGVHAVGQTPPVPGLPADPATLLDQLGISFVLPKGERTVTGSDATTALQGMQIVIDTRVLRSKLDGIPFDEIVNAVPDQAGQLKSALGAAVHLAPKLVITTGVASADVSTVPAIALPNVGDISTPGSVSGAATGASTGLGGASGGLPGTSGTPGAGTAGSSPTAVATRNAAAGLPPLASVPGALMVGGILLASGLGWWMQKLGAFVIGGAGTCGHGLETGVPDLRKA